MIILEYFFLFLHENVHCGYSLSEVLLMSTHNMCFYRETEKIIPELLSNTPA